MELPRLRMIEGVLLIRAEKIAASAELGGLLAAAEAQNVDSIATSDDIVRIFRPIVEGLSHEECWVLFLTNSNRIIERQRISQGGVQATIVDNRLIVKRALELLSTQIVLVHNHPSGAAEPSDADIALTRKVREAAALFDIRLLDHIIIAGSGFDAEIMLKAAPTKNDIGEIAYFLSALATPNPTVAHFTIEHDGIVEELDGICCMAGNTSVIQNDINLFPDCRMNDGMVDIAVIEPVKTVQLLPTVITAALDPAGKVLGRPQFKIIQTKEAKITCTPSLGMQFDGEIISSNSGVFGARALPQCLDLIVDEFSPLGK